MEFYFNKNAIKNKIQHYKLKLRDGLEKMKVRKEYKKADRKTDVASRDSFPASDPPGYFSKSPTDKELH